LVFFLAADVFAAAAFAFDGVAETLAVVVPLGKLLAVASFWASTMMLPRRQ